MKRYLSFLLVLVLMMSMTLIPSQAADTGMTFTAQDLYTTSSQLGVLPRTYEAVLRLPVGMTERAGVIMGNYNSSTCLNFEIAQNGTPRIFYGKPAVDQYSWIFNEVNVCTGSWVHLAIVWDAQGNELHCYVNGQLKQTLTIPATVDMLSADPMVLGGDLRAGNEMYFKGELASVALYSDMRTAQEIQSDATASQPALNEMIVGYDLSQVAADAEVIQDLSSNNLDAVSRNSTQDDENKSQGAVVSQGGMQFSETARWSTAKALSVMPATYEAMLRLPNGATARAGVVAGNYGGGACINFEITTNGNPRLYVSDSQNNVYDWKFTSVNVCSGEWVHVAIVRDVAAGELRCYVDGQLKQTLTLTLLSEVIPTKPLALGSDQRAENSQYFKGLLKQVALYSDVRTAAEIASDVTSVGKDALVMHYDLSQVAQGDTTINDLSGNGYTATIQTLSPSGHWLGNAPTISNYDYSLAVVGDTQVLAQHFPEKLAGLYDWLVDNAEAKKMKYVMGLGDITENNIDSEWQLAKQNITKLNSVVPYSLNRGNHDGSAKMNEYFKVSDYPDTVGGSYDGKMENTWRELKTEAVDYLIFTLDFGASDAVLNWASGVIEAHPNHNVILTTHAYLFRDGTTLDSGDVAPPTNHGGTNNGDQMWDKFVSKHKNIVLVLSGHDPCDDVVLTQTKGVNGNTVSQMLIDPQGTDSTYWGTGMVAMLYFSNGGRTVQVEYYSTARQQWFKASNQFTFTLDVVNSKVPSVYTEHTESLKACFHLGLSTATSDDKDWTNYYYVGQEFVPDESTLYGANVALAMTSKEATVHFEIRSELNGEALASKDVTLQGKGGNMAWYPLLLDEPLTVNPNQQYYLVYYLIERPSGVCIVYGTDHEKKVEHPAGVWYMPSGGTPTLSTRNNLTVGFDILDGTDVNQPSVDAVMAQIDALQVTDLDDKAQVQAARQAFDALTDIQKLLVENVTKLTAAEEAIRALEEAANKAQADKAAADAVMAKIKALQVEDLSDKADVVAARAAYTALTEEQQALVTNLDDLTAAEEAIRALEEAADKAEVDQAAADAVMALIEALPGELALADKAQVEAAREAYIALTEDQKALVSNLDTLIDAEQEIEDLQAAADQAAADKAAADEVVALIEALPAEITLEDKAQVEAARAAFDALTEAQKALVGNMAKLTAAEDALAALEQPPVEPEVLYGDADGNGTIDAADALKALQHAVKLTVLEGDAYTASDVDGNNQIDATDALLMLQYTVKLIDCFPVNTVK